jgi:GT2 family glycosyltransferase
MKEVKVSIIIIHYKSKKYLSSLLDSIKQSSYKNYELIFVDNNYDNRGFGFANNIGADKATGEYLFFLNNDTKLHPEAITELVKAMETNPFLGICGCKMMSYDGAVHLHTGISADIFGYPAGGDKTFYVEGSALMIRKKLFQEIGGFDYKYFLFHEDVDLSWRVRLQGWQVKAISESIVYHAVGASGGASGTISYSRRYLTERNNIRTLIKNYGLLRLLFILPTYLLINLCEMIFFALKLNPRLSMRYLMAYEWNIRHIKDTLTLRKVIQKTRKVTDREITKHMYKGIGKIIMLRKIYGL